MRLLVRLSLSLGYLAVVLLPLWLALDADRPEGVDPAYEVSLATGLVALSLLVVTFVLPKRMRALSRALGIDVVLGVHRLVVPPIGRDLAERSDFLAKLGTDLVKPLA